MKHQEKFLVGRCVNIPWLLWEMIEGEADEPVFQTTAQQPQLMKPNLLVSIGCMCPDNLLCC